MELANISPLFEKAKKLAYLNDTAHNIIQLNQKTEYGIEVGFASDQ
jgi:hypothetical protein